MLNQTSPRQTGAVSLKKMIFPLWCSIKASIYFQGETVDEVRLDQNESAVRLVLLSIVRNFQEVYKTVYFFP